jgi:hypothetical protein
MGFDFETVVWFFQGEGEDVLMKDGFFAPANVGVTPY